MENEEKKLQEFAPEKFELVNKDLTTKIHDEKFKTKPTTFAKDAFKRFCKNKSSVVAAVIIGMMLVGSVVFPLISTDDLKTPKTDQAFLPPKLFDSGTGWWDGTVTYTKQPIDRRLLTENGTAMPADNGKISYRENAIVSMKTSDVEYIDINGKSEYAYDGAILFKSDPLAATDDPETKTLFVRNYKEFKLNQADNVKVEIGFENPDNVLKSHPATEYRFSIYEYYARQDILYANLTDWQPYQDKVTLDLSAKLAERGLATLDKAKICIEAKPKYYEDSNVTTYMIINEVKFTCAETTDEAIADQLANMSFYNRTDVEIVNAHKEGLKAYDANASFHTTLDDEENNVCYYRSNGSRYCYNAKVRYVDVVYDLYEHVYGNREMVIGGTALQKYIDNGYCRLKDLALRIEECPKNYITLEEYPFEVIDAEKCPIVSIKSVEYYSKDNVKAWQFKCVVTYYKYKNMSSMPRFLMGTERQGFDMWTMAFNSLKTSLLVATICVAVCLFIGLIYGAISGYFGGTVDLVMERVTDILAGLPSLVLMTLLLIRFGRTFFMFAVSVVITGWIGIAGLTRTQFYRFRDREYVLASRTLGASDTRLIFRHILPNGLGTIITNSVLRIPSFIASEATIAYLGIGLKTTDSFGVILSSNQTQITDNPHLIAFPAFLLALLMISFNLFGNGLRDAVNPTLKGGE